MSRGNLLWSAVQTLTVHLDQILIKDADPGTEKIAGSVKCLLYVIHRQEGGSQLSPSTYIKSWA